MVDKTLSKRHGRVSKTSMSLAQSRDTADGSSTLAEASQYIETEPSNTDSVLNPNTSKYPDGPGRFEFMGLTDAKKAYTELGPAVTAQTIYEMRWRELTLSVLYDIDILWIPVKNQFYRTHGMFDPEEQRQDSESTDHTLDANETVNKVPRPSVSHARGSRAATITGQGYAAMYRSVANTRGHHTSVRSTKPPVNRTEGREQGRKRIRLDQDDEVEEEEEGEEVTESNTSRSVKKYKVPHKKKAPAKSVPGPKQSISRDARSESISTRKNSTKGYVMTNGRYETFDHVKVAEAQNRNFEHPEKKASRTRSGRITRM